METPRIHPDTIAEVKEKLDLVDIISDYVVLRKRGKDYIGLCPFHEEKTPSFTVNPGKQLYHCFGCGVGGNGFKFLMELGKTSFNDVVIELAQRFQVPIKTLEPQQRQELQRQISLREQLYEIMALSANFYHYALYEPQGEVALNYLKSERRLSEATIKHFQLGYAPAGWETLYHYLVEVKRYPVALVEQAGLILKRKSGEGYYDRFRSRLIIPIHDIQGRVIAFGSRTLTNEEPKYLNSPETPLFNKSKTLYALDKANQSITKQDLAILVEGYFDAIALHAAGITNVVATLGTAVGKTQLKQILRYTESKQVVLNFDADNAGKGATQRAITEIESDIFSGLVYLKVLHLPDGKDADEFLKSNPDAPSIYHNCLQTAPLWLDWLFERLTQGRNLQQPPVFSQVWQSMINILLKIEKPDLRLYYLNHCAGILSQGDAQKALQYANRLINQLKKPLLKKSNTEVDFNVLSDDDTTLYEGEMQLLIIYIHCPEYRQEIIEALEEKDLLFTFPEHRFLWQQIIQIKDTNNNIIPLLQERYLSYPEEMKKVNHIFFLDETTMCDLERADSMINPAIASLEEIKLSKYRNNCLNELLKTTSVNQAKVLNDEIQNTQQKISNIRLQRLTKL